MLGAVGGAHLEVHDAAMAHGDLVKGGIGQVEVGAVPAAPALVAGVGVVARARVRDHHGDALLARFLCVKYNLTRHPAPQKINTE